RIRAHRNFEFGIPGPEKKATSATLKDVTGLLKQDTLEFHNAKHEMEQIIISEVDAGAKTIHWSGELGHDFSKDSTIIFPRYVVFFTLLPKPSYPFPGNATLVRGMIKDANKEPVRDAVVTPSPGGPVTRTDEHGEFVLYFKGMKEDEKKVLQIKVNARTFTVSEDGSPITAVGWDSRSIGTLEFV
ncbi:MAG TPA: hypothetical protein HA257_03155, partial [Candidatus Methanoperedenaceae archaeon]|nr:hypothetical protein [Candidatus Methanoperedenaceae archaeon]